MASFSNESDSGEHASTTADEVEGSSRQSTTEEDSADSTTDTDSNSGTVAGYSNKMLTSKERKKYSNGILNEKKINVHNDTETKNLLEDVGDEFDEDFMNLQESEIDLDPKMFELSDEQLRYYTNCFLYLLEKTQGFATLQGALQGSDRIVLEFFRKSRLDDLTLSKIWSLCDVNEDGFLNHCEFIAVMHLIVLHTKGNVPIPTHLPPSARPPNTPTRSFIRFEDDTLGAFPGTSQPSDLTSDSSTKVISECISSSSGNSQQLLGSNQGPQVSNINTLVDTFDFVDMSTSAKQHSFSDDHLHSTSTQRETAIAKFSDVPPLLVDSQPTALNALTTSSHVLPEFARLLASTTKGPPPQPPSRDYNGTKGHRRSASLDLKTFSALSTTLRNSDNGSGGVDIPDIAGPSSIVNVLQPEVIKFVNKSAQTEFFAPISTSTQTIPTDDYDDNFAMYIRDLDTSKLSPKERCQLLQRINEQLEIEKSTLMQVRFQVQLRIEEAETEFRQSTPEKVKSGNKPTPL